MNALSDFASEVKFRERMRGYDYDEVDKYVEAVSRAAAGAKERIAELEHRVAQAESHTGNGDGGAELRETLLRTLVLAQRTADAAVSEARSEARSITDSARERAAKTVSEAEEAANERLRSAEERADRMLAESEENGQLIVAEAKRTAAAELASERQRAQEELRILEATKSELEAAVAQIQARLDNERDTLRSLAASFQTFVQKFEPPGNITEPAGESEAFEAIDGTGRIEAVEIPTVEDRDPDGRATVAHDASTDADGIAALKASDDASEDVAGGSQAGLGAAGDSQDDQAVEASNEPEDGSVHGFLPAPDDSARASEDGLEEMLPADAVDAATLPGLPAVGWGTATGSEPSEEVDAAATEPVASDAARSAAAERGHGWADQAPDSALRGDLVASVGPATIPFGVDSPELFDMEAEDEEFIEQLRQVVSSEAPLSDEDAAMAAFFDHDDGAGHHRSASTGTKSGNSGSRSWASGGGGRLGPRA